MRMQAWPRLKFYNFVTLKCRASPSILPSPQGCSWQELAKILDDAPEAQEHIQYHHKLLQKHASTCAILVKTRLLMAKTVRRKANSVAAQDPRKMLKRL